jgi:outer membrane protein OmpA-like peptidoglycan-associated protein
MHFWLNIFRFAGLVALLLALPAVYAEDMESAYEAREKAVSAGAETLAPDIWESAEKELARATELATKDANPGKVAAAYRDAIEEFGSAEMKSLEIALLSEARAALRVADEQRAKRYAPTTRALAREQLTAAEDALRTDPYATETIRNLADSAATTARYAGQIAVIAREKPSVETLIRERDAYINKLEAAAGVGMPADTEPDTAIAALEERILQLLASERQLREDLADSQAFVAALEEEIRELDDQLGGASAERRQLVMQIEEQARREEQFKQTEALFDPTEAEVFKQSGAIVLRLFGLEFASGSSRLDDNQKPLLNKIEKAISIYPGSTIVVEGHTDSQGGARMNQLLSQNRADAVREYIIMNMRVAPARISATGFGPTKPIATNDTREGKAKNRRIDLLITPAD